MLRGKEKSYFYPQQLWRWNSWEYWHWVTSFTWRLKTYTKQITVYLTPILHIFPPAHQNDCLQSLCSLFLHCLPCNRVLWINTGVELQLKIMRLHWASLLTWNKRVWVNCRSGAVMVFFPPIELHFDWWIGTLNKGFRSSLNERYRVSPRHSPEKNFNLLFLELSWLASQGPESTVHASTEGKMWFYDFHVIPVSSFLLSPGSFYLHLSP